MPEGPSIVILKDLTKEFEGRKVVSVSGNSKIDQSRIPGQTVSAIKSWGKHFLICFDDFTLRIHFLLFGTYRINERKETVPRLSMTFADGEINLYGCSIQFLEGDINTHYDWERDVMSDLWNAQKAYDTLLTIPNVLVCDALLEQDIFAGVGNIIKNEVLYRVRLHPESLVGKIPEAEIRSLISNARDYSFEFLEWKKKYELKKHWLAHSKKICLRCDLPFEKKQTGVKKRRSFYCPNCQPLYI